MTGLLRLLVLTAFLFPLASISRADTTKEVGFALVVTNNRSLELSRPDLHYADDDGMKYAQLFSEAYGKDRVTLLTVPDADTEKLFPEWSAAALPPTRRNLEAAVSRLTGAINKEKRMGREVHLHLVFAGHGDIHHGQGFIEMDGYRLTAVDLDTRVVAKLPADHIHLILDSCNSYFMLNPRGDSVKRWTVPERADQGLLEKYPNLGALISTSSESVTYEWSEVQSGIFSYEVRSALRGAADVDGRNGVSYAEVAAFVEVANSSIVNELYRPKVFARGPGGNLQAAIMPWPNPPARTLSVRGNGARRFTIRNRDGVRMMDIHKESGTGLRLRLPSDGGVLKVYETSSTAEHQRPHIRVCDIDPTPAEYQLEKLERQTPLFASRGEAPVFRNIFSLSFGKKALKAYLAKKDEQPKQVFGVSRRDVERLDLHLKFAAGLEREQRLTSAAILFSASVVEATTGGMMLLDECNSDPVWSILPFSFSGVLLGSSIYTLLVTSDSEDIYADFKNADLSSESSRSRALLDAEKRWKERVDSLRSRRLFGGYFGLVLGGILTAGAAVYLPLVSEIHEEQEDQNGGYFAGGTFAAVGLMTMVFGIYRLNNPSPLEYAWQLYTDQRSAFSTLPKSDKLSLDVAPRIASDGAGMQLLGRF